MTGSVAGNLARNVARSVRTPGWGGRVLRGPVGAWLVAHVLVLLALITVWGMVGLPQTGAAPDARGLFVWDSGWYRSIAEQGYEPGQAVRFFPLLPLLAATVAWVTALPPGAALILVTWAAALGYGVLVSRVARAELADPDAARRATWLAQLAPGAFVLALGYAEATAGLLAAAFFLFVRARNWAAVAAVGIASGLTRPTGLLLVVPALFLLGDRRIPLAWRVAAVTAPVAGTAAYLVWSAMVHGEALRPLSVQTDPSLRGGLVANPLSHLIHGSPVGTPPALALVLLAVTIVLLAVQFQVLPAMYGAWSLALVVVAVTAGGMASLPRYLAAAFPLAIAAAAVLRGRRAFGLALGASTVLFVALAAAGFTTHYVP